ncbi:MAG: hypothetical protein Q8P00_02745, partial [Dehalococcoidia bacterium]|nr:hypothetical protein [Dehalococcoidia bacterium]
LVAGQRYTQKFSNSPNQRTSFTWDGKDGYGRTVSGQQRARARVGYVYDAVYQQPGQFDQAFGNLSGAPITSSRARQEVTLWQEWQGMIGGWDGRAQGLGGWSLSVHHAYDPTGKVLYLGDGRRRSADALSAAVITTAAGGGTLSSGIGDGGPATKANLTYPAGVAVGPDGSLYIAENGGRRVRRVSPTGVITTVAGTGTYGYSGDGGPATAAQLSDITGVALGPDGSIYIADRSNNRIRRVGADGVITTVAGTGTYGYSGDGGPAALAKLNFPYGVAVGPDGSLYIADKDNQRVRRVGTNGVITTVAGGGTGGGAGDGGPATQAKLVSPWRVAVGPDGSLYILDRSNNNVRKVGQDGVISTVAGSEIYGPDGFAGDGGPATSARFASPEDIAVGPDGSLYIADRSNYRVRWVGPDGTINTVAGNGTFGFSGDGGLAVRAQLNEPRGIALAPDGSFYITDWFNQRVRRVAPVMQGGSASDIYIPDEDGSEVYVFDSGGRHLRTLDALTSGVRYQFSYDSSFRLVSVTDGSDNSTTIERNTTSSPTAIVGPYGQRTTLALDANGYLSAVTNPAGESVQLSASPGGLLIGLTDRRGNAYTFQYDGLGRLTRDEAPGGGYSALSRLGANETYTVSLSTALTRTTSYRVESLPAGGQRLVSTFPNGLNTELVSAADGTRTWRFPNGATWTSTLDADPRWGMLAP